MWNTHICVCMWFGYKVGVSISEVGWEKNEGNTREDNKKKNDYKLTMRNQPGVHGQFQGLP